MGVDDERVSQAIVDNGGVLKGHSISREAFSLPSSLIGRAGKDGKGINSLGERNSLLCDIENPLALPKVSSELVVEGTDVRDEGSRQEGVSDHSHTLFSENNDVFFPTLVLVGKTADQSVGEVKFVVESLGAKLDLSLLLLSLGELVLKLLDLGHNAGDLFLDLVKLNQLLLGESLGFLGGIIKRLDVLVNLVVGNNS